LAIDTKKYANLWVLRDPTWLALRNIQNELIMQQGKNVNMGEVVRVIVEFYIGHSNGSSAKPKTD
jgi:hypothetical protein